MKIIDIKPLRKLAVIKKVRAKSCFGFSFMVYTYRNVIGISSKVYKDWHVIFADYERKKLNFKKFKEVMEKNNMCLLCVIESSKGKYHLISPQCYDWLRALNISKKLGAEKKYLSLSAVRGEFILRISKKGNKPEPKLKHVLVNEKAHNVLLSRPHLKFLELWFGVKVKLNNNYKLKGKKLKVEKYRTTNL